MNNLVTILSFTYPYEAHLAKSLLESEGIEVFIKDELTAHMNNFYSNAIGGIKLQVRDSDYKSARQILVDSGYINKKERVANEFWFNFDKLSSKLPLIGKSVFEIRLVSVIALTLIIISIPVVFFAMPTKADILTDNYWCIEKIYYKGQDLCNLDEGLTIESNYNTCFKVMNFIGNGKVFFPRLNSLRYEARWELVDDSLIITPITNKKNSSINNDQKILVNGDTIDGQIYLGRYHLELDNRMIKMKSKKLSIIGRFYYYK